MARNIVHEDWQLRTASDYLEHDIRTFAASIEIYQQNRNINIETANAALDSVLTRARLLIDFFFRDNAWDDDVIAIDYFHDFTTSPYTQKYWNYLRAEREKINKRLVHTTTKGMPRRRSYQSYSLRKLAKPIVRAFRKWLTAVPDSRLYRPAQDARDKYEEHLDRIDRLVP